MLRTLMMVTVISTFFLSACQTTGPTKKLPEKTAPQQQTASLKMPVETPVEIKQPTKKVEPQPPAEPLVFGDDLIDEFTISKSLRAGQSQVEMLTPEGVNINEIPESLDMWLSRIKDSGGTVKAQAKPESGESTRGFLGIFIDVALYLIGLAKDEYVYSPADEYDARLIYDKATGNVEKVLFIKRAPNS
ncbi:MAG: hypothetical protein COB59_06815 [Rhodospirillaceae bacterium]|nr:MAG: hypothetical protein COB59_06815 [Rhodospirillaceae bacterium]